MDDELKTIQDVLNYLNEVLIIYGENQLDITQLKEIQRIVLTLSALEKAGITTDNYGTKRKAYYKFRNKWFDSYGIEVADNYPFSNPKDLYIAIDDILKKANLNDEQRHIFYQETELRERSPRKRSPKKHLFDGLIESSLSFEEELEQWAEEEETNTWDNLSQEEKDEIYGITPEERQAILQEEVDFEKYHHERAKQKAFFKRLKYIPSTS